MRVSFYSDADEPLRFACRLIRRVLAQGQPLGVVAADETLRELDALLWSFDPTAFIPHRRAGTGAPGEVLLVEDAALLQHRAVLLNLGDVVPSAAAEFARILEVVPSAAEGRAAGRRRYREYQSLGAELDHFSAQPAA
ncbi:DNA polymerase III subunit chi [Roseateles paludis]|uniref:DNA polymerase III subunit chi n=1 Tax=Roseateles paludis TaxID=3145238 RepID=A0ABV0G072_9BURK